MTLKILRCSQICYLEEKIRFIHSASTKVGITKILRLKSLQVKITPYLIDQSSKLPRLSDLELAKWGGNNHCQDNEKRKGKSLKGPN